MSLPVWLPGLMLLPVCGGALGLVQCSIQRSHSCCVCFHGKRFGSSRSPRQLIVELLYAEQLVAREVTLMIAFPQNFEKVVSAVWVVNAPKGRLHSKPDGYNWICLSFWWKHTWWNFRYLIFWNLCVILERAFWSVKRQSLWNVMDKVKTRKKVRIKHQWPVK